MRKLITIDEARRYANHADWQNDANRALNTNYERMLRAACALAIADLAIMQQPHGAAARRRIAYIRRIMTDGENVLQRAVENRMPIAAWARRERAKLVEFLTDGGGELAAALGMERYVERALCGDVDARTLANALTGRGLKRAKYRRRARRN